MHSFDHSKQNQIVIVGGGVAGLSAACTLAHAGKKVRLLEKNPYLGGKLSHFEIDGFHFDAGPSLFTSVSYLEQLFEICGRSLSDYLDYERLDTACHYFYADGTTLQAYTDAERFAVELENKLGEPKRSTLQYLHRATEAYTKIGSLFLDQPLHELAKTPLRTFAHAIGATKWSYLFSNLHDYNKKQFKNPKTQQLFDRFATYNGSDPYQAPAMLSMIPHLEHMDGTFYPRGGMIQITKALTKLATELGVLIETNTAVHEIISVGNNVKGVLTEAQELIPAEKVLSNMDVYFTYQKLLGQHGRADKIAEQERSSSAIIFYWGVKGKFPQFGLHNILFSTDYKTEFEQIFRKRSLSDDPTVYINITSKLDPSHAPADCENWFVMVNAPCNVGQDWDLLIQQTKVRIIQKFKAFFGTDLSDHIVCEQILDPRTIESKTSSYMGSLYGTSSNNKWAAFLRHPNKSPHYENLFFAGGSVHPGGGIPLCLRSGQIAANLILKESKSSSKNTTFA